MSQTLPQRLFLVLSWAALAVFLAVTLIEWRLGSIYHTILALGLAGLIGYTLRSQRAAWPAVVLMVVMLAFGIFRALSGYALLRGA